MGRALFLFVEGVDLRHLAAAVFALLIAACSPEGMAPAPDYKPDGKVIFNNAAKGNCIACHRVTAEKYVGPGLAGTGKIHSRAWLEKWLADPQKTWDENDPETREMRKRLGAESRKFTGMKLPNYLQNPERAALADYLMTL